ncbi:phospholipase D-like domain-containing protein [Streptomyces sp. NPDC059176]|uniref:phospholipase D-like domain-containing protein n=1 Tax=unclassified Streptomyces TaxID=2593676 RepID=UPI0036C5552F
MHRRTSWLLGATAAAGLLTALLPTGAVAGTASQAQSAPVAGPTATFNDPAGDTAAQSRIRDHIIGLIDGAAPGSTISVSMYSFTENPVTDALVAAKSRGVHVRVVIDHTSSTMTGGEYTRLAAGLGTDRTQSSWVLLCPAGRGCLGTRVLPGDDGAINHNKFFLFSSTGGTDDVVVQASANMTNLQRTDLFNNAVTIPDAGLYDNYQAYFADLVKYGASASGLDHYYKTPISATDPAYKAYFFPRRETTGTTYKTDPATDTVKLILDKVDCKAHSEVRMAANLFYRDQIASKLVSMVNAGCSVILAADGNPNGGGTGTPSMGKTVEGIVSGKLTQRVECWENPPAGRTAKIGLHSKYLLVNGTYNGAAGKKIVWTGSHNYSWQALRANDETLLKIDNAAVYDQFKANHVTLMSYCAGS